MTRASKSKLLLSLVSCSALCWATLPWVGSTSSDLFQVSLSTPVALARTSGGRSGGGSFSRPSSSGSRSSGSRSSSGSSQPRSAPSTINRTNTRPYNSDTFQPRSAPVIVPVPVQPAPYSQSNPTYSSGGGGISLLPLLVVLGGGGAVIWLMMMAGRSKAKNPYEEIDNDKVTVTKLQVALLATARSLQKELTDLSLKIDTGTQEGLLQLLQEAALAILRHPEYWTHVCATSETVDSREAAQQKFNQLSIAERSKFSEESLVNVGGQIRQKQVTKPNPDETAAYIVVTLLIGTANDHPLFDSVQTPEALQATLEKIAAFPADYLFVVELMWSPQDESDSLTYDELLTEYTDMRQI